MEGVAARRVLVETSILLRHFRLPLGRAEAEQAARVHADLVSRNEIIGIRDVFIAGTCLAHRLPILTENEEHYRRVRGLTLAKV